MLSRRVITRGGRHFRGRYPSRKLGRMVVFESLLERDVIELLEFSHAVVTYREQPELVMYSDGEKVRKYYPDFKVVLSSGLCTHVEVKTNSKLASPSLVRKLDLIKRHYDAHREEDFRVVTDRDARKEPLYANLRTLSPLRARMPSDYTLIPLCSLGECWAELEGRVGRSTLLNQIATGYWSCDLSMPLQGDLMVYPTQGAAHDSFYL